MAKGFFITIVRRREAGVRYSSKTGLFFQADLVEPVEGWPKTRGETIDALINDQKLQYEAQLAAKGVVPDLVESTNGPMASGQTVRFVEVG